MKKIILVIFLFCGVYELNSQNYLINFTGSGAISTVDSVRVENITQCTKTTINGGDILNLLNVGVGIESTEENDNSLIVYSNPFSENCRIDFYAKSSGNVFFSVFDILGKEIIKSEKYIESGEQSIQISGVNKGVYFLHICSENYYYVTRLYCIKSGFNTIKLSFYNTDTKRLIISDSKNNISKKKTITNKSIIQMQYNSGDILKFTGISAYYRTISMLVANQNQTINFNFVECIDSDGNHYPVVQIGTQLWMGENLNTTKYRNGDNIPNVTNNTTWENLLTDAYCDYNNDPVNSFRYGRLYNYYAIIDTRNLCPVGWHVATDAEWNTLATFLGGANLSGGKLKQNCYGMWGSPNTGATNETGFTALSGGERFFGSFSSMHDDGYWWTSTNFMNNVAYYHQLFSNSTLIGQNLSNKSNGMSIRCVHD